MKSITIGIDFGTTKTLVAYPTGEGDKPEIAHLGRERNSLPTSAFIGESGVWEFGDDADDYACDPALADRYSSGFKLKLGSTTPTLQVFGTQGFQAFSAQRISALFFAHVREKCTKEVFNGRAVSRAVITHPVKFSPAQLHDLRNAAEQAGFSDITLMREPEAAGLAFCRLCPQDLFSGTALIVDWGGGTLDLALVSRKTDSVQIHNNYVAGHNHIGGNEFDELMWKHVKERLQQEYGIKLSDDSVDFQRLQKKKIRAAKEKLSRVDSALLSLSGKQGAYPPLKLTREELETVLKPTVQTGIDLICRLLNSIQEGSLKPSQILLIGGSSQIPLIRRLIEESTKIPCGRWQYSHEAVALGAALKNTSNQGLPTIFTLTDDMTNIEKLTQKSNSGDAEASWELAQCYDYGRGCHISKSKAQHYYLRCYQLGKKEAAFHFEWLRDHPEYVKMIDGEYYNPSDEEIISRQHKCRECIARFNESRRMDKLHDLLPGLQEKENVYIDAPFLCDFGENIHIGSHTYVGMNCLMLDSAPIYIGERVIIDAGVQIYTATHPIDAEERSKGLVMAKSVVIEDDVYIGPGAIICPGVTLGKGAVIDAGAVVTHDVPSGYRAQGNPAICTRHSANELDLFDELD